MATQTLTPDQLEKLQEVRSPTLRRRFALYFQLPNDVQHSLFAEETAQTVWQLVKETHKMPESAINPTARIIGLVMLGEVPIGNFVKELSQTLGVNTQKAQALAKDINEQVFQPVRESLMQVHDILDENAEQPKQKVPQKTTPPPEKPVGIDKLEDREDPEQKAHHLAEQRRKELIERLKTSKQSKNIQPSKKQKNSPRTQTQSNTTGTQAAWNGKTIDLRKVPPRRESPAHSKKGRGGEWEENGVRYLDPRDLA